ncbi:MAG: hypothetical protein AAF871_04335 [Pseudomonadota bacterium]
MNVVKSLRRGATLMILFGILALGSGLLSSFGTEAIAMGQGAGQVQLGVTLALAGLTLIVLTDLFRFGGKASQA